MKKIFLLLILTSISAFAVLPPGTIRVPIYTDGTNVLNNPITFSNQVSMTVAATNLNQLVRYQEFTNSLTTAPFGNVFTTSNNTFVATKTNTFNGIALTSNLNVRGTLINKTITYPGSDGTSNQVVATDGAGNLSFISVTSGSGGGDVFLASNNVFTAANTFRSIRFLNGSLMVTNDTSTNFVFQTTVTNHSVLIGGRISYYTGTNYDAGIKLVNSNVSSFASITYGDDEMLRLRGQDVELGGPASNITIPGIINGTILGASPAIAITNFSFYGNGAGLTNLNASNLSSGTIPTARYGGEVVQTNNAVFISSLTNAVSTGAGTSLVSSVASRVATFKSLLAGTSILLNASGTTNLTISFDTSDSVYANALTNVVSAGGGTSLVSSVSSRVATLKNILPGTGILFTDSANSVTIGAVTNVKATGITIDGGGSVITTGVKGYFAVPYGGVIRSVTMLADTSGSITVDIWKTNYAGYPPVLVNSITAAAIPSIVAANKYQDTTLSGWTTTITAGDVLGYNVTNASSITRLNLILKIDSQ